MRKYLFIILYATILTGCEEKIPPPPEGAHGALYVRRVELSDQPRFKYLITVATADDPDRKTDGGHIEYAGYTFYTNVELVVGQPIVADTTIPYVAPPRKPSRFSEPEPTPVDSTSAVDTRACRMCSILATPCHTGQQRILQRR